MEEEQSKIERPFYQKPIYGQSDRNQLVDTYVRRLVAEAIKHGWNLKDDSVINEQAKKTATRNARILEAIKKEKAKQRSLQIDAIKEELPKCFEFHMPDQDEPKVWFLREPDEKVVHEFRDKFGKVVDKISASPMQILNESFFDALLSLPNPLTDMKKFREALHAKYDQYIVHQFFPMHGNKPMHQFKIKLVWKI